MADKVKPPKQLGLLRGPCVAKPSEMEDLACVFNIGTIYRAQNIVPLQYPTILSGRFYYPLGIYCIAHLHFQDVYTIG